MTKAQHIPAIDPVAIGRRVRRLRKARSWYQKDLAAASGIDDGILSTIETAQRPPSLRSAIALAVIFRRSVDFILFGTARRGQFWKGSK